ncbi:ECI1 isomerase, partial [Polypterus senegalus]
MDSSVTMAPAGSISLGMSCQQNELTFYNSSEQLLSQLQCVAVVTMKSPPVNSLSLDFLTEFSISIEKLEMDRKCRGVILTSGSSPAGGCLMAMACDYRIMADNPKYSIGLNETLLGIVAPFWFKDTMMNTIGFRATELALQLGLLHNAPNALRIGLVDELAPEKEVLSAASTAISKWLAIPDHARQITKSMMRKPTIDRLLSHRDQDINNFVSFITKDSIQKSLQVYMERLKQRKT